MISREYSFYLVKSRVNLYFSPVNSYLLYKPILLCDTESVPRSKRI